MADPRSVPPTFLGLPDETSGYEAARLVVLPLPLEVTTTYGTGTGDGPAAILDASRQVETYEPDLDVDLMSALIHTAPPPPLDGPSHADLTECIRRAAAQVAADGKWVLGLGGEHTVTLGLVRAVAEQRGPLSILQIDAHLDLRSEYDGTPYSHACVMRRCVEDGHRTVHVGIRNACREEVEFARDRDLPVFWARDCAAGQEWIDAAVGALEGSVYLTVDVDGLDPSVVRTTGTPEPGGLGWWQTMRLLDALFRHRRVVGADVVELAPSGDLASDFAAARLAARIAALALYAKGQA
ncbi:MAG TPA: agmatinase [Phycisphaerae bacterium]|nr:agmatinase [Phycisphaerae bacterium]